MLTTYKRLWQLLTPLERRQTGLLLALILVMGLRRWPA
jgi:hypothetical protein